MHIFPSQVSFLVRQIQVALVQDRIDDGEMCVFPGTGCIGSIIGRIARGVQG